VQLTANETADLHEVEYWARQIRLGAWIAIFLTAIGGVRVLVDWPSAQRWWIVPIGLTVAAQAAAAPLNWERIVRSERVRNGLVLWYVGNVGILFTFCAYDRAGLSIYPAAGLVIVVAAGALLAPRTVLQVGILTALGYLGLAGIEGVTGSTYALSMTGILAVVVGLCVKTAENRRRQDRQRQTAERRTEALLENVGDAIVAVADGKVVFASDSVRRVLGYEPGWLTIDRLKAITHPDNLPGIQEWAATVVKGPCGHTSTMDTRARRPDGSWGDLQIIGTNRLDDPDLHALILSVRDVTEQKTLEGELTRQAFEDSLTGLPNRALFRDRVEHAVARNRRGGGRVTLFLVDLDDFKMVNDTLGHAAGDRLIEAIAVSMSQQVRPADTLARLGGDEFAVLIEDVDEVEAAALADRLLTAIRQPVRLGDRDFVCSASIGVATIKADGGSRPDTGELLRDADLAMYAAKAAGRDRFAVFDPAMYADILREADERSQLEHALASEEFLVHYQPIVDLPSGRLVGVEALVRWQHPQRGLLGPNTFIPLAETTGLIVPLGRWVLRQACLQAAAWHENLPGADHVRVSVNLSPRQFQYEGLVGDVRDIIAETGIDPHRVVLEITESLLMQDTDATSATFEQLRALGVQLAIDDFGTGYSSLSYLKRFQVDILKIDRSFVDGITTDPEDATLAEAVVQLGRALHLQTVAEGIETHDQHAALRLLGCEYGQGFLFAKPAGPREIENLLTKSHELQSRELTP
jgi:diguanylate cyclase (GGDEF)-like protein/PAS domain S-box-containing protein